MMETLNLHKTLDDKKNTSFYLICQKVNTLNKNGVFSLKDDVHILSGSNKKI